MNVELEYGSEVILKEIASEVLEIKKDYINILGTKFLISINEKGNFTRIKNIKLDKSSSFKLTHLLWNLAFVNLTIQRSGGKFGHADAKRITMKALRKIHNNLKKSSCIYDITTLIHYLEIEGLYINNLL